MNEQQRSYEEGDQVPPGTSPTSVGFSGPALQPMPMPMSGMGTGGVTPMPDPFVFDAWNYRPELAADPDDLAGLHVEAADGRIGKVDKSSHSLDDGYLIVDVGLWIFGRRVVIPAGTVNHVDRAEGVVYVDRTKDQVKASPAIDAHDVSDPDARAALRDYYGRTYTDPTDPAAG